MNIMDAFGKWPGDETAEEIQAALKDECQWTLTDRQCGYWTPGCMPKDFVLKVHGARFCCFCGKPLQIVDGY